MEDLSGKTIDRYKIVSEIGHGGMAVVYRAVDTVLDRNVAIKIILPEFADKEKLLKRFNREAKTLAKLSHSNIVKVLDYGEYTGSPYIVMEFMPGGTLSSRMGKALNYVEAAAILAPVARALHYAHQQKVVHRDVKPANILINESGQALLSDFGILKLVDTEESHGLTGTGKIVGTPSYMSPEQIRSKEVDGRSDIYSLGVVYFEMITGKKPYVANTPIELSLKHLNDPIPKARQIVRDLPPEIEHIFLKAMAKKLEERYQSMAAFADDLEKIAGKLSLASARVATPVTNPGLSRPTTGEQQAFVEKKPNNMRRWALIAIPVILVIAFGAIFFFSRGTGQAVPELTDTPAVVAISQPTEPPTGAPEATSTSESTQESQATATEAQTQEANTATPQVSQNEITLANISKLSENDRVEKTSVISIDWTNDGKWIIDAGSNAINFIDPTKANLIDHKISLPNQIPTAFAISPNSDKIYVLIKTTMQIYDIASQKLLNSYTVSGGVHSIAISSDSKFIALGILDNKVQLITPDDGKVLRTLRSSYGGWSVAFSTDGKKVVGGNTQGALMWESETGTWLNLSGGQDYLMKSLAFSRNGKYLAGGSKDTIFIWDAETGDLLNTLLGKFGNVNSLDFSKDSQLLVAGNEDSTVMIWNVSDGSLVNTLHKHVSPIYSVKFSPNGEKLVTGANEGVIIVWGQ